MVAKMLRQELSSKPAAKVVSTNGVVEKPRV
jgi:hypothetical protein